ncbi:MAG: hypothetical protein GDA54_00985 [Alphaproteobacteria bacterium GM7ARS4]|nr:hypothetical protein [Alphaproteobacteria bacterium GM7ARS4]
MGKTKYSIEDKKRHGTIGGIFLIILMALIGSFYLYHDQQHGTDLQSLAISLSPQTHNGQEEMENDLHPTPSMEDIVDTPTATKTYKVNVSETDIVLLVSTPYRYYKSLSQQRMMHMMHDLFHPFYVEGTSIQPPPPVYIATIESHQRHLHYDHWLRQDAYPWLNRLNADRAKEELSIGEQLNTTQIRLRRDDVSSLHDGLSIRDRLSAILSVDTNF